MLLSVKVKFLAKVLEWMITSVFFFFFLWCNPLLIPTSPHLKMFSNLVIHLKQKCQLSR